MCPQCSCDATRVLATRKLDGSTYRSRRCGEGHTWWTEEVICVLPPAAKAVLAKAAQGYYQRRRERAVPEQSRAGAELAEAWR